MPRPKKNDYPLSAVVAIVIMVPLVARVLQGWLCRIGSTVTWDYGPVFVAIRVRMLLHGVAPYTDFRKPPWQAGLVYNPVVPFIAAALTPLFGDSPLAPFEAGQFLNVVASGAVCVLIFILARRAGAHRAAALIVAFAFILSPLVEPWGFTFRVDVPALGCELAGLYLFQAGLPYPAVALFVLGFFVKQMRLAGIASVLLYSWLAGNRRQAIALGAIWLGAVALITTGLQAVFPYYWLNAYQALAPLVDLWAAPKFLTSVLFAHFALFALAAVAALRIGPSRSPAVCFLITAAIFDTLSSLRWGSNIYYFLPTLAAGAIVAAPELSALLEQTRKIAKPAQLTAGAVVAWAIVAQLGLGGKLSVFGIREVVRQGSCGCFYAQTEAWDPHALETLHSIKGTVLTDVPELALLSPSHDVVAPEFAVLMAMRVEGSFDDRALISAIRRREIAAFAWDSDRLDRRWRGRRFLWPELRQAITANYSPVPGIGPPYLMVAKRTVESSGEGTSAR